MDKSRKPIDLQKVAYIFIGVLLACFLFIFLSFLTRQRRISNDVKNKIVFTSKCKTAKEARLNLEDLKRILERNNLTEGTTSLFGKNKNDLGNFYRRITASILVLRETETGTMAEQAALKTMRSKLMDGDAVKMPINLNYHPYGKLDDIFWLLTIGCMLLGMFGFFGSLIWMDRRER